MPLCCPCCQAPYMGQNIIYILDFLRSETVRKLLRRENTLFMTSTQPLGAVNFGRPLCCPCSGYFYGEVKHMKILLPLNPVCHGIDYNLGVPYRAKHRRILGRGATIALYKLTSDRHIHTARTGGETRECNSATDRKQKSTHRPMGTRS